MESRQLRIVTGVFTLLIISAVVLAGSLWLSSRGEQLIVSGISMQPTLNPGQKVRLVRDTERPYRRGDLVAVSFRTRERMMVKRIIAMEGDDVIWRDEQVFVNGSPLVMDGWPEGRRIPDRNWKLLGIQLKNYGHVVPKNNVIVMGDNTSKSYDSGDFGMLSMSQISGHIQP
jgi:signal peptidase I